MEQKIKYSFSKNIALLAWLGHIAIAVYFYARGADYAAYYWGAGFMLVVSLPYLIARIKNKFIVYEAVYLYLSGLIINYTSNMFLSEPMLPYMDEGTWAYVMKLALGGAVAFLIGYRFKLGKVLANKLPLKNFLIAKNKLLKLPVKLYFVGTILHIIFSTSFINPELAKFQGWKIINILMRSSILTALMIDVYFCFSPQEPELKIKNKKKYLFRFLIFLSVEIIYGFLTGMRENIFMPVVLIFIAYMKATKKIPYATMLIFGILFITFIMPFMKAFRSQYWYGMPLSESLQYASEQMSHRERAERIETSTARISNSIQMAVYCVEKRRVGEEIKIYKNWTDYIFRFIPRFIWPGKPSVDYNKIGRDLGLMAEDDYSTSISLPLIAAFILDNGVLGVIFGMFVIGIIIRISWDWLMVRSGENFLAFSIYFNLMYTWMKDEEFYVILHSNLAFLFYTYLLLSFVDKGRTLPHYVRDLRDD